MKTITIASLIRNREQWLPSFFECIWDLEYDKKHINILLVVNDSQDNSLQLCKDFESMHKLHYKDIKVIEYNLGEQKEDRRVQRYRPTYIYSNLAKLRNFVLDNTYTDYLFFVDSDIMVKPDTLKRLLKHNTHYVSALIVNGYIAYPENPEKNYNILDYDKEKELYYYSLIRQPLQKVDITGAVTLMSKRAYTTGRYNWHIQGEDIPMCKSLQDNGVILYCDTTLRLPHCMTLELLERYKKNEFNF